MTELKEKSIEILASQSLYKIKNWQYYLELFTVPEKSIKNTDIRLKNIWIELLSKLRSSGNTLHYFLCELLLL